MPHVPSRRATVCDCHWEDPREGCGQSNYVEKAQHIAKNEKKRAEFYKKSSGWKEETSSLCCEDQFKLEGAKQENQVKPAERREIVKVKARHTNKRHDLTGLLLMAHIYATIETSRWRSSYASEVQLQCCRFEPARASAHWIAGSNPLKSVSTTFLHVFFSHKPRE